MRYIRMTRLFAGIAALWPALWIAFAMPAFAAGKCELDYVLKDHLLSAGFMDISAKFYSAPGKRQWSRDKGWLASYALDPGHEGFSVFVGWRALDRDMSGLMEAEVRQAINVSSFARKVSGQRSDPFVTSGRLGGDPFALEYIFVPGVLDRLQAPNNTMHQEIAILAGPRCVFQAAIIGPAEKVEFPIFARPIRDGIFAKIMAARKLILAREGAVTVVVPVAVPEARAANPDDRSTGAGGTSASANKPEKLPPFLQLGLVVIVFGAFFVFFCTKFKLEKDAGIYCLLAAAIYLVFTLMTAWTLYRGADDLSVQVIVLSISVLALLLHAMAGFVFWSDLIVKAGAALVFTHATFVLVARFYARLDGPFFDLVSITPAALPIFFFLTSASSMKSANR